MTATSRGSEWLRWEPHIHTPGTVLADGYPSEAAWDDYLTALESVSPTLRAIGVTDYCITRSYERLKGYKEAGRLPNCDLLFPNVELRLNTGTVKGNFVNIHLLVCPSDPNHIVELNRFLSKIEFNALKDKFVCTQEELVRLGRRSDPSLTKDEAALAHGCSQFKVSLDNLLDVHRGMEWASDNILIAVAANADGTSGVKGAADATLREEIEKAAHAIFASSPKQRDFWLGNGKASLAELHDRYGGPKPCIWGCDAHDLSRVAKPDEDRLCWIKGAPTFDTLMQACIDPERAYVGATPPSFAAASQIIDQVSIENAPWAKRPVVKLNPGLVAVIGARGSGKTAFVDVIATGCDSYEYSERPSFLERAEEHLAGARVALNWAGGETTRGQLDSPVNNLPDAYPRARYLSQQFVEELCSVTGMPRLIQEIERVIFDAHDDRDGTVDFEELLNLRVREFRDSRQREEEALANISDQIGLEMDKLRQVTTLTAQVSEKAKLIARYEDDRKKLLPKGKNTANDSLQELNTAADTVRGHLRFYANQQSSLTGLATEVQDVRKNRAPHTLRLMKDQYQGSDLKGKEWAPFLLGYTGDVDSVVSAKAKGAREQIAAWKGTKPTTPEESTGSFLKKGANLGSTPLAVLEAEIERLQKLVAADADTAKKLIAISKRISGEKTNLERLRTGLKDCEGAKVRAEGLVSERELTYARVFEAILEEERVLKELYAPLMIKLKASGGTLGKLAFTVTRVADVDAWAERGEQLFDKRGGPFKGIGSLAKEATGLLLAPWVSGDSTSVLKAMAAFRAKHQDALLEKAPYSRTDQANYRPWSKRFAQWLYSTEHIRIEYGITYGGTDIRKLSPGTRGIVLLLLYLALDDADDRPLIIDQPEENLDPKSVYDELVPLFQKAKRRRQVVMVTHNANLVINADADQIIIANVDMHSGGGLPLIDYVSGGLEEASIRTVVCDILEGGELAFKDRARRLRIALRR